MPEVIPFYHTDKKQARITVLVERDMSMKSYEHNI